METRAGLKNVANCYKVSRLHKVVLSEIMMLRIILLMSKGSDWSGVEIDEFIACQDNPAGVLLQQNRHGPGEKGHHHALLCLGQILEVGLLCDD